ncbi:unnamed protein product [Adineta steineri]|uniref:Uncharacterized protein n=1 Tax=Adineta steineri TaxID=433720 RepID=A0A819NEF6_9BILA|nr:unnamed protein product [Adineta steineri]CAF3996746.1 unnamed protein product [Adineta steineri]
MYTIKNDLNEFQRYERGFGNRRSLINPAKYHYSKEVLSSFDNQDGKYLFSNPYEKIEQNDVIHRQQQEQQQQQPLIVYR